MKAMVVNSAGDGPLLIPADVPKPEPGKGEVLIRVRATGVTPSELQWYPTTHTKDGGVRRQAIPGHEFSGDVAEIGRSVGSFKVGDEIYGMNDWFADGATAEYCVTKPENIALKPKWLCYEEAAAVPIGALTAWQGLENRAKVQKGERVLIHGAAGGVGVFAVQLARFCGAYVIATVSARKKRFVMQLGAKEVIDYTTTRFEEKVGPVDIVFDAVGGETLARSWGVLKAGGRMVTIASDSESTADPRVKGAFFTVEPNQKQLREVAEQLDDGTLQAFFSAVVPLEDAAAAYGRTLRYTQGYGRAVISVAA